MKKYDRIKILEESIPKLENKYNKTKNTNDRDRLIRAKREILKLRGYCTDDCAIWSASFVQSIHSTGRGLSGKTR